MPAKTIYVSEDDLPILKIAQEKFGGNLSGAIIASLKRLMELEGNTNPRMKLFELKVGAKRYTYKSFTAILLAKGIDSYEVNGGKQVKIEAIYLNRDGSILIHTHLLPDDMPSNIINFGEYDCGEGVYALDIAVDIDQIEGKVTHDLYKIAKERKASILI